MRFSTTRKTWLSAASLLMIIAMIVSACGAPASAPAPAAEAPAAEAPAAAAPAADAAAAPAEGFNWKAHDGEELKLLLNQHPYQQALVGELDKFTELTGIKVTYDVFPEQNYFDKVTIDLQAGEASTYDVFMTGAYMIWQYSPAGWMEPLEPYINDPAKTNSDYDF